MVPLGGDVVCDSDVEIWGDECVLSQRYWDVCGAVNSFGVRKSMWKWVDKREVE